MTGSFSIRWLLALVAALWLPFCCCDVRSVLHLCGAASVLVTGADGDSKRCCHYESERGRSDQHAPNDCGCAKLKQPVAAPQHVVVNLAIHRPLSIGLSQPGLGAPSAMQVRRAAPMRELQRRDASLLRQHCALIV